MRIHLTRKSKNKKTGPIPVSTTEERSCPTTCPWYKKGCYANSGPLRLHWKRISDSKYRSEWKLFLKSISSLPVGQIWRHNQAGDLPGIDTKINKRKLQELVKANRGRLGFTYTHKPVGKRDDLSRKNSDLIKWANKEGFTINLSGNSPDHADYLSSLKIAPVTTVLPSTVQVKSFYSKAGNKIIICPATYQDKITCDTCKLCAISDRKSIIGFPAHGISKKYIDNTLNNNSKE